MVLAFVGGFLFLNFKLSYFFKKYSSFFVFISFSILYFITAFRDIRFGGSDSVNYQFLYNSLLPNEISNLFTLNNLETTGKPEGQQEQGGMMGGQPEMGGEEQPEEQPEDEFPTGEPMDVEKTIQDLKSKLGQNPNESAKPAGRPRHINRMGKDDHMYGRDAFGDKELKKLSRSNESFIKSIKKTLKTGGAKVILEGKSMMDEQNIIE
jgi:hypothetical protein